MDNVKNCDSYSTVYRRALYLNNSNYLIRRFNSVYTNFRLLNFFLAGTYEYIELAGNKIRCWAFVNTVMNI
jgi:hypothetical protein